MGGQTLLNTVTDVNIDIRELASLDFKFPVDFHYISRPSCTRLVMLMYMVYVVGRKWDL